jgi:Xaa-Pro aminopeptidase
VADQAVWEEANTQTDLMEPSLMRSRLFLLVLLVSTQISFGLTSVPKGEYRERRVKLAAKLRGGAALIVAGREPSQEYQEYRQDEDFYYLTGSNETGSALLVIGAGPAGTSRLGTAIPAHAYREILFLPIRNLVMEKYKGESPDASTPGVAAKFGVDEVMPLEALPGLIAKFVMEDPRRARTLWTQTDMAAATATMHYAAVVANLEPASMPAQDVRDLIIPLRMVKSAAEIELLRKAADASVASQLAGMRAIKPGVAERTVEGIEVQTMMTQGCERQSYPAVVGSGVNSTVLHYMTNENVMAGGGVVVIDAACEYSMYASDLTRTMPVGGKFTARQKEIYDIVLGAQRAAEAAFVAGKSKMGNVSQRGAEFDSTYLDKVAYDYINTHGKDLHGEPLGKYFLHGVGHGVGIDVHDPSDYSKAWEVGAVFTIEPGIYIPEEKIGVRIEDTYYVDGQGKLVNLGARLPHTTEEVEAAMRGK